MQYPFNSLIEEVLPESQLHGNPDAATLGTMLRFVVFDIMHEPVNNTFKYFYLFP